MNSLLFSIIFFLALGFGQLAAQLKQECGISAFSESRISGGTNAKSGDLPWMVALHVYYPDIVNLCGGSLINNQYVLTAAHCLYQRPSLTMTKKVTATMGHLDNLATDDPNSKEYISTTFIPHKNYMPLYPHKFDIALIKLETNVELTKYIIPICLPVSSDSDYANRDAVIAGWGILKTGGKVSSKLQQVNVKVIPEPTCKITFMNMITKGHICAEGTSGKGSCKGDSGGPLMVSDTNNQETVIGIVSFGGECGDTKTPSVFTRVTSFLDWIKENAGMN